MLDDIKKNHTWNFGDLQKSSVRFFHCLCLVVAFYAEINRVGG